MKTATVSAEILDRLCLSTEADLREWISTATLVEDSETDAIDTVAEAAKVF